MSTTFRLSCAEQGIVVFNTPGANANGVKELVIAGMLLASRDIVGGMEWVADPKKTKISQKLAEKEKRNLQDVRSSAKSLVSSDWERSVAGGKRAASLGMEVYGYDPYISVDAAWKLSRDY